MPARHSPSRDLLLSLAKTLPPSPRILAAICELLQDINTDVDEIAGRIRMDTALAARVIRVSNSVVYGGSGTVGSVDEAIGRVGFSEVVRLVGTATIAGLVDREQWCYHVSVDMLRESLLMHALATEALAEVTGLDRPSAYVAGLMRGIGMMVLDRFGRERLDPEETYDPTVYETYRRWEAERFGIHAVDVTLIALDEWQFPDELVQAIQFHLSPSTNDRPTDRFSHLINLAGAIAIDRGQALPGEVIDWLPTPEKFAGAAIDDDQFQLASERAAATFEQQRHALF